MTPQPDPPKPHKPAAERFLESILFHSRWLMAPIYLGLVLALMALVIVFAKEAWHGLGGVMHMTPEHVILMALSLIDLSLAGNLLLIVIFSGYENFVSKIDTGGDEDRPAWMGTVDFSGLKLKLVASIVAISAIALLRAFMRLAEGEAIADRTLMWLVVIHLTFIVSGVLLAAMDWISGRTEKH
jgi:uncharacterized protein (TIGR00645 family)